MASGMPLKQRRLLSELSLRLKGLNKQQSEQNKPLQEQKKSKQKGYLGEEELQ